MKLVKYLCASATGMQPALKKKIINFPPVLLHFSCASSKMQGTHRFYCLSSQFEVGQEVGLIY